METLEVLSPWAEVDYAGARGLNPRVDNLDGKRIGMFAHFKGHSPVILKAVEEELTQRYPNATFTYLQYPKDTREAEHDPEFRPVLEEWLKDVDCVIAAYGDAGSCAMYHAYNTVFVEKLGVPAVLLVKRDLLMSAARGAAARFMPELRMVLVDPALPDLSFVKEINDDVINNVIKPNIHNVMDDIVAGLTTPLTEKEKETPTSKANKYAHATFTGTPAEINEHFYRMGYTDGLPIVPPTREAVDEMLRGTDLPRDYIVAELPPMLGKATVEKIAVNAVMAGCLPIHLPFIIAAVEAMMEPQIHLVGWTCSVAGFAPNLVVSGPAAKDAGINATTTVLSPYFRANSSIGKALAFIIMNISGSRPGLEDNAYMGHEGRFFTVYAEDEEHCPWEPVRTDYGFAPEDTAVFLHWSHEHAMFKGGGKAQVLLANMCSFDNPGGFDPGCTFILSAAAAKLLADEGMTRQDVKDYICEYARKPSSRINARWMRDNNHMPATKIPLPQPGTEGSARKYWTTEHLNVFVAGAPATDRGIALAGGGDHGGPAYVKVKLPANWDALVAEYAEKSANPDYIDY